MPDLLSCLLLAQSLGEDWGSAISRVRLGSWKPHGPGAGERAGVAHSRGACEQLKQPERAIEWLAKAEATRRVDLTGQSAAQRNAPIPTRGVSKTMVLENRDPT